MHFTDYYQPDNVGKLMVPQIDAAIQAGVDAELHPASEDDKRVLLLLVDAQVDFIHEDGALSVPGAVADTQRTVEWFYRNAGHITQIAASLDSHLPRQIFFPTWWVDETGRHPAPFTPITADEVQQGRWQPVLEHEWSRRYVRLLEEEAKKTLMIWPYHTLIGTPGHAITPALYEAIAYHAAARATQPIFLSKGSIPKTEHYSIMEPEVKVPEAPLGELNVDFLELIASYDTIFVAGQAKSHCVLETVTSMVKYFGSEQPSSIEKIHMLMDSMSSVAHPEIDFDNLANQVLQTYADKGVQLLKTDDVQLG